MTKLCFCGKPLHYTDKTLQSTVQGLCDEFGENMTVTVSGRSYRVQRHYIALHGIKGKDIEKLGFKEVVAR